MSEAKPKSTEKRNYDNAGSGGAKVTPKQARRAAKKVRVKEKKKDQ